MAFPFQIRPGFSLCSLPLLLPLVQDSITLGDECRRGRTPGPDSFPGPMWSLLHFAAGGTLYKRQLCQVTTLTIGLKTLLWLERDLTMARSDLRSHLHHPWPPPLHTGYAPTQVQALLGWSPQISSWVSPSPLSGLCSAEIFSTGLPEPPYLKLQDGPTLWYIRRPFTLLPRTLTL